MKTNQQSSAWRFTMHPSSLYGLCIAIVSMAILPCLVAQESSAPATSARRAVDRQAGDSSATAESPPIRFRSSADRPIRPMVTEGERALMPAAERAPERAPARFSASPSRAPLDMAPARFEATVYEVQIAEDQINNINVTALEAKAATPQELAKALEEFGKPKVLYKIDQTVNLFGESISLGTHQPIVTNSRSTAGGSMINSVTYQQVGLIVNLTANSPLKESSNKVLYVQMNVELAATFESGIEISPQTKAASTRNISLSHSETPRFGKPLVLLNVSVPGAEKSYPVAYVIRYVFREVKN